MVLSQQLCSLQFVLPPLSFGLSAEKLQVAGASGEDWLGAGDAGSVGSQHLQTVNTSQWVGSTCSLPELLVWLLVKLAGTYAVA